MPAVLGTRLRGREWGQLGSLRLGRLWKKFRRDRVMGVVGFYKMWNITEEGRGQPPIMRPAEVKPTDAILNEGGVINSAEAV